MNPTNFLIGRGELLTREVPPPKRSMQKAHAYTLPQALERLTPQIATTAGELDKLPPDACPNDMAVALFTLNPSYIARSFFPNYLLNAAGLSSVGSRSVKNKPERWTRKIAPKECLTTQLFVAGKRQSFRKLNELAATFDIFSHEAEDFTHIEEIAPLFPRDRIVSAGSEKDKFFEIGIHLMPKDVAKA